MKLSLVESRPFGRICYGYKRDKQGLAEIVPEEAGVVRTIFDRYKTGNSLEAIQTYLLNHSIPPLHQEMGGGAETYLTNFLTTVSTQRASLALKITASCTF